MASKALGWGGNWSFVVACGSLAEGPQSARLSERGRS
jgi:hypothetical protein